MDALNAKPTGVQFGLISYGMDYLDPSNMLGVFLSGGRHTWSNAEFDALVKEAGSFTGDPTERVKMFQDAEKILVEDAGGVFVYHQTPGDLIKPYPQGTGAGAGRQRRVGLALALLLQLQRPAVGRVHHKGCEQLSGRRRSR
jgi:ABC-type transport system substrate-binding protein